MALGVSRTLLALFVTFCAPGCGWSAEKPLRSHNGKQTSVDKGLRESWEPSIHLDGRPVDRFVISSNKPMRAHRFTKEGKDNRSNPLEDVDPEWVNLDGFAVLGGAPVSNSAGPARSPQTSVRNEPSVQRATRVNRTAHPSGVSNTRTHRRPPQSSSGPRQPERLVARTPLLDRRRKHHTKPQSDQRNRHSPKLTSESVHVVSLQAQKALGQSAPNSRAAAAKTTTPEPPEYEARDISVRVMSPQSVLISWIDPAVEMGKVDAAAAASRSYTVKYREKGESARWEYKDSTQRRMMIDSLSADGMYEFSVRISQGENHGKWSVSVFQRTPESAPSGPPENFEVKPLRGKGTAVIATWDEPEEPNGRIREYILSYAPAMKPFGMKTVTYRGSITSATIDGLTPGDRYIFKIRATNRRGQGPQSKAFSVAMPGSSRGASSFSKNTDSRRSSQTPSKQDTDLEESDLEQTEAPTEPTTTTPRPPSHPVNRRVRPLSQSRSYHSIFSSVRGSVRNGGGRSSFRDREKDKEEEEEEKPPPTTTPPTTPAPVEETTTMEVIIQPKEPDNDVSPEFDEEEEIRPRTTETPSLKVVTPSPTKPASRPKPPQRRPVKIRIHQRPGSKTSSDSTSDPSTSSGSSSSSNPSTSSGSSSSSNPSSSSGSSNPSTSSGSSSSSGSSNPSTSSGSSSSNPSTSSRSSFSSGSSNPSTSSGSASSNPSTSSRSSSSSGSSNPSTSSGSSSSSHPSTSSRSSSSSGSSNPSTSSGSSSSSHPSTSSGSSSSSHPSTSSSSTNPSSSSRIQESAAKRIDYTASTYPESKNTYDTLGTTHNKPVLKETHHETDATSLGRGAGAAGRTGGSRYGYGRRNPGILFRGNSTRNGYKPGLTSAGNSNLNFPSRSQNHAAANTHSSATTSQSTFPSRTQKHETSNTFNPTTSRSASADGSNSQVTLDAHLDKSQSGSQSHATSNTHSSGTDPSTSQSGSKHPSTVNTSGSSQSTSHRGSHIPVKSQNTPNSHTSPGQDTVYKEGNDYKETDTEESEAESTSSSQPSESERKDESRSEKPAAPSRTRSSSSLVERYPWLATRYPGRFGPGSRTSSSRPEGRTPVTRTSSSIGAGRPILRGTPTRVSGATGATGLSTIQETNEDSKPLSTDDSLKNGVGAESLKPSLTHQNVASSDTRKPTTSSSSSSSSSNSDSHRSSGHRDSNEPTHTGTVTDNNKNHNKDNFDVANSGKNEPTDAQTNPALTSGDSHRSTEDNESVDTRETSPRTRPGSSPGVIPIHRRPNGGVNGRVRSPLLANRQFGGSRFPIRPQPAQNSRLGSSASESSSSASSDSYGSSSVANPALTSNHETSNVPGVTRTGGLNGGGSQSTSSSSSSSRDSLRGQGGRSRYPIVRGKPNNGGGLKPSNGNGKNGRPNLTVTSDKESSASHGVSKSNGQRFITGPDGTKWLVDLERGVLMNSEGQILQDSQGKPKRVVLGEDGRTIFDHMGSPLVNQDGVALFGHGRDSRPVVNPKDKVLMVGGKPVLGLNLPHLRTTTTTTRAPTTTTELTTPDWYLDESTTAMPYPTCPPGTFSRLDEYGYPVLDPEGILDCYPEEESSGMEMDNMVTVIMVPDALALKKDEFLIQTTLPPTTTTTTTTATTEIHTPDSVTGPFSRGPSSEFDLSGKKRFTAPYVNYIQKDPSAPCSLTEALEYLQVDVLENLIEKDSLTVNQNQPPKNKPHNLTVVAMEGCHSFIILDWGRPMKDDMVSGYMVYSASYDDVLNNRWSSKTSTGTHLAVENLKPNSRYYFKVQAKNVFGLGPVSDTLTYVTESDDPLLIERPPGGEPIWIPFTFKYNPIHSSCKGSQYVKRTWYRKFVGVVLCNSLRYKIFMGDGLRDPFYSIGDTVGQGEDHCQFVDSYRDGRTGPAYLSNNLPSAQGYYRAYRQEPVSFGVIGRRTPHPFVGWYECGVPIPGKW